MPEWMTPLLRRLVTRPGSPSFSSTTTVRSRARSLARAHPTTPAPTMTTEAFSKWGLSGERGLRPKVSANRRILKEPDRKFKACMESQGGPMASTAVSPLIGPPSASRPPFLQDLIESALELDLGPPAGFALDLGRIAHQVENVRRPDPPRVGHDSHRDPRPRGQHLHHIR